ncbi:E3 ubiquitin-protein ligase TRIM71 [Exaiptasia diaphana]|nr:E3 ubiquitin-protein ligase TRIM71 [Exaiptasia diaphana]
MSVHGLDGIPFFLNYGDPGAKISRPQELQRKTKLFERVHCPLCKYGVNIVDNVALQALPSPFFITSLQKLLGCEEDNVKFSCSSCDSNASATSFCFDCKCFVCSECIQIHEHMRTMRSHRIMELEDIHSQDMRELVKEMRNCKRKSHQTEPLEFYCVDCGECICEKCQTTDHQHHRVHKIQDAKVQTDEQINEFIDGLNLKISSCQFVLEKMESSYNSAVEKIVEVRKTVRDKVTALVNVLRTHEKNMVSQLEQIQLDLRQNIFSNKKGYEILLLQMVKTRDVAKEIVDRGIDIEMLNLHNSLLQRLNELMSIPVEKNKHKSITFDYAHNASVLRDLENTDIGRIKISFTDPTTSEILNENLSVTATGERQIFTVVTRDSEGDICYSEDDRLSVSIQSEEGYTIHPRIDNSEDGNYKIYFQTPLKTDVLMVHVLVMGTEIRGSPYQINVMSNRDYQRESLLSEIPRSIGSDQGLVSPVMSAVSVFGLNKRHFGRPCGISSNGSCDVFAVADSKNATIHVLGIEGKVLRRLGHDRNVHLSNPVGTTFDQDDNIFVTDCDDHVVKVFDPLGNCTRTFGSRHLQRPLGICRMPDGSSFICDSVSRSVKRFSFKGSFEGEFKSPDVHPSGKAVAPYFIAHHKDKLFVTFDNHSVQVFDIEGKYLYKIGNKGHGEGRFKDPRGVAVDAYERLFVCDTGNHRVQVFSEDGRVSLFGSYGAQLGQFDRPQDIALASDGSAFVTDYNNARIQAFRLN